MSDGDIAVVLKIKDRYFAYFGKHKLCTAWSLAGAKMFGLWQTQEIETAEKKLADKGYASRRVKIAEISV